VSGRGLEGRADLPGAHGKVPERLGREKRRRALERGAEAVRRRRGLAKLGQRELQQRMLDDVRRRHGRPW